MKKIVWPWTFVGNRFNAIEQQTLNIRDEIRSVIRVLAEWPQTPVIEPKSFVAVLVEGTIRDFDDVEKGRIWCGGSGQATRRGKIIEVIPQRPLTNGRVIVFADLERVAVGPIFVGTTIIQNALGDCPVATFDVIEPGVMIRVNCSLHEGA